MAKMIYDPKRESDIGSGVVGHIVAEIADVYAEGGGDEPFDAAELAIAVDLFLREEGDVSCVSSDALVMLASKALRSLGEIIAARRLLLFATGMVRPSEWLVSGTRNIWVLDLKGMMLRDDSSLELVFFECLKVVINSLADVWDDSMGEGVLGLKHICGVASNLLGGEDDGRKVALLANEIKGQCSTLLEQIGTARGWVNHPVVMDMDP